MLSVSNIEIFGTFLYLFSCDSNKVPHAMIEIRLPILSRYALQPPASRGVLFHFSDLH